MLTSRARARARRDPFQQVNIELFYQIDQFMSPIWFVLSKLELEITEWINVQWLVLGELRLRDNLGVLEPRPDRWWIGARPWSTQWWNYLRRHDGFNEQRTRPYFVSVDLGDVRGLSEWNMPFGMQCPTV